STARATGARNEAPRVRAPPRARLSMGAREESLASLLSRFGGRLRCGGVLEPMRPALTPTAHRVEIRLLHFERHRPGCADQLIVHLTNRCDLGRGAAHEHLVGEVKIGSDQVL